MKKVFLKLLIPLIIIACFALSYISTAQANITIVPKPKKVEIRNYDVILGDNWHILVDNLKDEKKGEKVVKDNLRALRLGFDYIKKNFKEDFVCQLPKLPSKDNILISANESLALGTLAAGLNFLLIP